MGSSVSRRRQIATLKAESGISLRTFVSGFFFVAVGWILMACQLVMAGGDNAVKLASDFALQVYQYPAASKDLLIWLPSKYGIRKGNTAFSKAVQAEGIDYWLVDLHQSYLAPSGRHAYKQFQPQHIKELIDHAVAQGWQRIILGGESRGASLAMRAARLWQLENPGKTGLKGLLFYHPYLIDGYTQIGQQADFQPIASETNLPVYLFQPELNTKYLYSEDLLELLEIGGAAVYQHRLQGVRGGFHVRDIERLNAREKEERRLIGQRIRLAVNLMNQLPTPDRAAERQAATLAPRKKTSAGGKSVLVPIDIGKTLPLSLPDDRKHRVNLADYKGEVVLVNFWATWCGPCVREIDSLIRLIERFKGRPFRVLTVNIGETEEHVATFLEKQGFKPNFDLLFDADSTVARTWKVYAVPSTYLLDKQQKIRYGYRGALEWDRPDVVKTVRELLE